MSNIDEVPGSSQLHRFASGVTTELLTEEELQFFNEEQSKIIESNDPFLVIRFVKENLWEPQADMTGLAEVIINFGNAFDCFDFAFAVGPERCDVIALTRAMLENRNLLMLKSRLNENLTILQAKLPNVLTDEVVFGLMSGVAL